MPAEAAVPLPQQSVDEQPPFQHCMDLVERLELLSQSVHHVHDDTEKWINSRYINSNSIK